MNKPKLFVDEDACEEAVVSALRRLEHDVLTVLDVGRGGIGDEEQLRFASSLGRAIYSLNACHFAHLHGEFLSRGEEHAGIIVIPRQRYDIGEKLRRLRQFLDSTDAQALKNTLHFL